MGVVYFLSFKFFSKMKALFTFSKQWVGLIILAFMALQTSAQNTCASPVLIASVPFSSGAQTTCGTVNDYAAGFSTCVSSNYGAGEDYVYSINITTAPVTYNLALGGAATWKIASVHSACPPAGGNCVGGIATSSGTTATGNVTFPTNGTYYIIVDTWPAPDCGGFTLDITVPPPPPANDNCSGAIAFPTIPGDGTCATLMGNTANATQSQAACTGSGADDDVWFSFVAPATTVIAEITAISGGTDRVHQIFSGTCGSLVSVKCSDPESSTTTGLTVGATYYIRVHTYGTGSSTAFNLCLKVPPPPPTNDNCAGAIPFPTLPFDGTCVTLMGNTAGATQSQAACTGSGADDDIWFSFVAPASTVIAELTAISGSSDRVHQIFSGTCGSLVSVKCSDPESSTTTGLTVNATYYIRVHTYGTGNSTEFNLCLKVPPPPPVNDECATAIPLTVGTSCSFAPYTNAGATSSVGPPAPGCASFSGGDVWFSAVVPATGRLIIDSNTGSLTDGGMAIYSGNCGALTLIECDDDDSANGLMPFIDRSGLTPGSTVYIRFWEFGNDNNGTFSICAHAPAPPCTAPGTPSASNVSTTSATLNWAAAPGATSYRYSSGTAGHVCGTGSLTTASTSVNLSGLTPNTTYTFCVRTDACGGGSASSYVSTTFTTAPLPNDACAGAQTITCGSTTNGSTVGAASDAAVGSCGIGNGGTPGNGVWYKLVGNGAQVTASLCASAYDTKIHVYTGTCGGLTCLVSNDDNAAACGGGSTRSQVIFNANVGTDYYILVSGFSTNTGAFSLSLTCLCGPALGAPWTVTNIGASNGGAIENVCDGTIDVKATNYGSPTNDVQTYAWQQLCGNGFIKAKVENVTNGGWGGIMFRENNAGGSKKVALRTQLTSTVVRDLRAATNGVVQQQQFPRPNTPQWLRLTRTGNVFTGETSIDGVNWDYTFTVTLVLPSCIEVGLFAQSINVNTTTTAVFSNIMGVATSPPVIPLVDGNNNDVVETQEVLSLFPNPATDEINVKMEAFYGKNVTISVQNQLGQAMLQREIDDVQDATERIELTNLPSGIYTLTLRTAGQAPVSKQFMVGSQRP